MKKYSPYSQCPPGAYCDQTYNPTMDAFIARLNISNFTTGISDIQVQANSGLNLYPNPGSKLVTIEYQNAFGMNKAGKLRILDISGREMSSSSLTLKQGDNLIQLDLTRLPSGIYMVEIDNGANTSSAKFVKK